MIKDHKSMLQSTRDWWQQCLNNPEKLEVWLISLYNNEKDAEDRFIDFANKYCQGDKEAYDTFYKIAKQEAEHAILVEKVITDRGLKIYEKSSKDGRYWRNTLDCIVDKQTAAAIGAFAEGLSLKRMRVIIKHNDTPQDIRDMFKVIEPEESYHAKVLEEIATKYGMDQVRHCHDKGLEELGLKIRERDKHIVFKRESETITVDQYRKIVAHCNTFIFPKLYRDNFKKTFLVHDFKEVLQAAITDTYDLEAPLEVSTSFNHLYIWLHSAFKNWLKSKSEDYTVIEGYLEAMNLLDREYQGSLMVNAITGSLENVGQNKKLIEISKYLDDNLEVFQNSIEHFTKKPKRVLSREDVLSYRKSGYLTVGTMKEFIKEYNLPDDAIVVVQRVQDAYFEGVDISGANGVDGTYPHGSKSTPWGVYLKSQDFPDDYQYHPAWCCPRYNNEDEILFIDLMY